MKGKSTTPKEAPQGYLARVRAKLGHLTHIRSARLYLNTGSPELNAVLGERDTGIAYGKIVEISGFSSAGKTAMALDLAAAGQSNDEAHVVWLDFENSFDQPLTIDQNNWYQRRGLVCHKGAPNFTLLQPYVGKFLNEKVPRLITAEEMLNEAEEVMIYQARKKKPIIIVTDSVTGMLPEEQSNAGIGGQNMRTTMALPVLLGDLLRRWTGMLPEWDALAIFLNQLRTKPGMSFGDPNYTPGGNALPFYAHSRIRMRRVKGGRVLRKGRMVGLKGVLINTKNKAGGIEGEECGFRIYFDGRSQFVTPDVIKGEK